MTDLKNNLSKITVDDSRDELKEKIELRKKNLDYMTMSGGALFQDLVKGIKSPFDELEEVEPPTKDNKLGKRIRKMNIQGNHNTTLEANINPYFVKENKQNISIELMSEEQKAAIWARASKKIDTFSPRAYKIYAVANAVLVANNNEIKNPLSDNEPAKYFNEIKINEEQYYRACGYTFNDDTIRKYRQRTREALEEILNISVTWEEKVKGFFHDVGRTTLISAYDIKNGIIRIEIPTKLAEYYLQVPLQTVSKRLLLVDERNPIACKLGAKLLSYASINRNIKSGQYQILSTKKVLESLGGTIKTIEYCRKKRQSRAKNIKTPIIKALDELFKVGVLEDYYFYIEKGKRLDGHLEDNSELDDFDNIDMSQYFELLANEKIKDYEVFEQTYLYFKLTNDPHPLRMEIKELKEQEKNKKNKKKKRKTS